jgi:hypothetical protein
MSGHPALNDTPAAHIPRFAKEHKSQSGTSYLDCAPRTSVNEMSALLVVVEENSRKLFWGYLVLRVDRGPT